MKVRGPIDVLAEARISLLKRQHSERGNWSLSVSRRKSTVVPLGFVVKSKLNEKYVHVLT